MSFHSLGWFCIFYILPCYICLDFDQIGITKSVSHFNICSNIEIWGPEDAAVSRLKNCTVVEGYVRLMQFDTKLDPDIKVSFPNLMEITGYLMVFRLSGAESLGEIFPSLSVVRGDILFESYAIVIFETFSLKTIGLTALREVIDGDLFIASNVNLCFVDTLDWSSIASGNRKHYIAGNKNPNECPVCDDCPKLNGKVSCWSHVDCQTVCPSSCTKSCTDDKECCHSLCLGGCWGMGADKCFSCKHYRFKDTCVDSCPRGTYIFSGWRCLLESECYNMKPVNDKYWKPHDGQCVLDCPPQYYQQEILNNREKQKKYVCRKCEGGTCRKECQGALISNVADSERMRGCTHIKGGVLISLSGHGKNILPQLEKNLKDIQEISEYLKISDSYQLTSLNFLRNLKYIWGEEKYKGKYSLIVIGNKNLELLWDFNTKRSSLKINGAVYFRSNPKLCPSEIEKLVNETGVSPADSFYPLQTNGVKNVCNLRELSVSVENITSNSTSISWSQFDYVDLRKLLGYVISIKEALYDNVTVLDGRNECGGGDWKEYDVSSDNYTIRNLKPFSRYAFYVKTQTVNADSGARSPITYFNTLPSKPTIPLALTVKTNSSSEMTMSWAPPLFPYGIISHYLISIYRIADSAIDGDYCENKVSYSMPTNNSKYVELDSGFNDYSDDTKQNSYESSELSDEQRRRLNDIHFENKLQNYIYVKRPRIKRYILSNETENNVSFDSKSDQLVFMKDKVVNRTFFYVSGLKHFTKYMVELRACRELMKDEYRFNAEDYCSDPSYRYIRTHPLPSADLIPDKYLLFEVSRKDHGTVSLKWEEPAEPNGNVTSYTIEYKRSGYSSNSECVNQTQYKSGKSYILRQLRPGNYSVRIRANSLSGEGPFTSPKYFFIEDDTSIFAYLYLIWGTLFVIMPVSIAYCVYFFKKTEKNKLFISVNPEYSHKTYVPDAWEIPRNQIDLIKEIGQGSFGMVYEGLLNNKPCAVKTVNAQASEGEKKEFLNEACVMKAFDTYHVVKLLGVVSFSEPVYVVMELMPNGDLKSFLRSHRPDVCDPHVNPPSMRRLLQMAAEIADGMAYLSAKKYVHRDLAARNCMVAENLTVKIGDFGMARDIYVGDYYRKGTRGLMPVRWMAPESLKDGIFLSASDVWSYGIVLYEMVTLAAQPYQGLTNDQVLRYIMDGGVMERPENCADKMWNQMKMCWRQNPGDRPTFLDIVEMLHEDASLSFHTVSFYDSEEGKEHRRNAEAALALAHRSD